MRKRRNLTGGSLFSFINSGCFFHRSGELAIYCPSRLTDYRCVMWTEGGDEGDEAAGGSAVSTTGFIRNSTAVSAAKSTLADQPATWDIECSTGDFSSEILRHIDCLLPLVLLVLGTACNCMSGRLVLTYSGRQLPVCLYLTILACTDTALLWSRCLDLWLQSALDVKLSLTLALLDESACQLVNLAYSSLQHFKSLLQVALAIDTCRLVRQPLNRVNNYSREWVKNSAILACVLVVLFNAHHLWTLTIVKESPVVSGDPTERILHCGWTARWPITDTFTDWLWPIGDLLVGDVIPVALTIAFSLASLRWLLIERHNRFRNSCNFGHQQQKEQLLISQYVIDSKLYRSMQKGLLACCFGYGLLRLPPAVYNCMVQLHLHQLRAGRYPHQQRQQQQDWLKFGNSNGASAQQIESELYIYLSRLFTSIQLCISPLLLIATVPRFRRDFGRLCDVGCRRAMKPLRSRLIFGRCRRLCRDYDVRGGGQGQVEGQDFEANSMIGGEDRQDCRDPMLMALPPPPPPPVL